MGIFLALFILEKFTGVISRFLRIVFCRCLHRDVESVFSDDLYRDVTSEAQIKEYNEAKELHKQISNSLKTDPLNEFQALRTYYRNRIELKMKQIKYHIACDLA